MKESGAFDENYFEVMERRIRTEADRKIFHQVFDSKTLDAVQALALRGVFEAIEHIISTGKEAHVFLASDAAGKKRAVKIYKKEATGFKKMNSYIVGDRRFRDLRKGRWGIVFAWARKEFKNMRRANGAGLSAPMPIGLKDNVLVMEFIGNGEEASPRLKDTRPTQDELERYREQVAEFAAGLYLAGLVHADLSEYNILVRNDKLVVIDFGQAMLLNHEKAKSFFERDMKNMAIYFTKSGLETTYAEFYAMVKARKEEMEKWGKRGRTTKKTKSSASSDIQ